MATFLTSNEWTSVELLSAYTVNIKKNFIFASSNLKIQYLQCTNDNDSNDISFALILFPSFGFVSNIPHTPRCSTPTPRFFVSECWVCRVLGLFRTFHTHTPRFSTPTLPFFVSEFQVCCQAAVKLYNAVKRIDATCFCGASGSHSVSQN